MGVRYWPTDIEGSEKGIGGGEAVRVVAAETVLGSSQGGNVSVLRRRSWALEEGECEPDEASGTHSGVVASVVMGSWPVDSEGQGDIAPLPDEGGVGEAVRLCLEEDGPGSDEGGDSERAVSWKSGRLSVLLRSRFVGAWWMLCICFLMSA